MKKTQFARTMILAATMGSVGVWTGCGPGKPTPPPAPDLPEKENAAAGPGIRITPGGGEVSLPGIHVQFPQGCLSHDQIVWVHPVPDAPVEPARIGEIRVSPSFAISAGQAAFQTPAQITLRLNRASIPMRETRDPDIYPVLRVGRWSERLSGGTTNADGTEITFPLPRLVPMINGSAPIAPASVTVGVVADMAGLVCVKKLPWVEFHAPPEHTNTLARFMPELQQNLALFMQRAGEDLLATPPVVQIILRPLSGNALGQASAGHTIELDPAKMLAGGSPSPKGALSHEFFHLIQQQYKIQNLKRTGHSITPEDLYTSDHSWFDEGTAEWAMTVYCPEEIPAMMRSISCDYSFISLLSTEDINSALSRQAHQYQNYIFFAFLDTLYDGKRLIRDCLTQYLGDGFVLQDTKADEEYRAGPWSGRDVLDLVLQSSPDRQGRKRNLREVYSEFLLRFNWLKNFSPLDRYTTESTLGAPGQLRLPPASPVATNTDFQVGWNIPETEDGNRVLQKKSELFYSELPLAIAKAFNISSMTRSGETGDLSIELKATGMEPRHCYMVIFPVRDGVQKPLVEKSNTPVILKGWEKYGGAVVWAVDVTRRGGQELQLNAKFQAAARPPPGSPAWRLTGIYTHAPGVTSLSPGKLHVSDCRDFEICGALDYFIAGHMYSSAPSKPFHPAIRVSREGGGALYALDTPYPSTRAKESFSVLYPLIPGKQTLLIEALDPGGQILDRSSILVEGKWAYPASTASNIRAEIETLQKQGAPRAAIFKARLGFAWDHLRRDCVAEAALALKQAESDFQDVLHGSDKDTRGYWLACKADVAWKQSDLKEYIATLEQKVALEGGTAAARAYQYEKISKACVTLAHDVPAAWDYWQKYQAALTESGLAASAWPYVWPTGKTP